MAALTSRNASAGCVLTVMTVGALIVASPLVAQTTDGKAFVTGSLLGNLDRTFHENARWGLGAGADVGAFLTERWSIRAEVEIPRADHWTYESYRCSTPPNCVFAGAREQVVRRHMAVAGLVGFHPQFQGRVSLSVVFGMTDAYMLARNSHEVQEVENSPWNSFGGSTNWGDAQFAFTFGVDAEIRLARAVSMVPQVRIHQVLNNYRGTIIRPGAGLRWRF